MTANRVMKISEATLRNNQLSVGAKRVTRRVTKAAATTSNSDEELLSTYHSRKRERRCESC
jgi:hypothetical protein